MASDAHRGDSSPGREEPLDEFAPEADSAEQRSPVTGAVPVPPPAEEPLDEFVPEADSAEQRTPVTEEDDQDENWLQRERVESVENAAEADLVEQLQEIVPDDEERR